MNFDLKITKNQFKMGHLYSFNLFSAALIFIKYKIWYKHDNAS